MNSMNVLQSAWSRFVEAVVGPVVEARVAERLAGARQEASDSMVGFRRITAGDRDITPTAHARMILAADKVYRENPLGKRIVDITLDHTVGDGIQFQCHHEELQAALLAHWSDDENDWEENLERYFADVLLDGELFLRPFVNSMDGSVRWSPIYNRRISEVVADPDNPDRLSMIDVTGVGPLRVIRRVTDPKSPKYGFLDGEVLAFQVNRRTNALRGTSDILHLLDWLDAFDQTFWAELERQYLTRLFVFDFELKGADRNKLKRRYNELKARGIRPGEYNVHNENEILTIKTAESSGADPTTWQRFLRDHVLGASGYPSHWFGDLHGATRASALESADPALRRLRRPQRWLRRLLRMVLTYVRDQWILARPERRRLFTAGKLPEISVHNTDVAQKVQLAVAKVFASVTTPLAQAQEKGWIDADEARDIFRRALLQHLGLELKAGPAPGPAPPPEDDPEDDEDDNELVPPPQVTGAAGGDARPEAA